jgi:ABC-2 type transport system ATP-binding protein
VTAADPAAAEPGSAAAAAASPAIATFGLTKRFGPTVAVDDLDLRVPAGSVFGFLGPNGAGKTTTIRMLLGLVEPTAGRVELFGRPVPEQARAVLPTVGALVDGPAFYPWMTGQENLVHFDAVGRDGTAGDRPTRVATALGRVGLSAVAGRRYRGYSLGMRQRLGLAAALLRPRRLLILDEPTNGMDPQGTREIRHLIQAVAAEGVTVFLSSHQLSEVEQVCSHVAVMAAGRLIVQSPLDELQARGATRLRVEVDDPARAVAVLERLGLLGVAVDAARPGVVVGTLGAGEAPVEECSRQLVLAGVGVRAVGTERPSLEDLFVALTGEGFDVAS